MPELPRNIGPMACTELLLLPVSVGDREQHARKVLSAGGAASSPVPLIYAAKIVSGSVTACISDSMGHCMTCVKSSCVCMLKTVQ